MISEEGERVAFGKPFSPKAAGGQVERWLGECEASMRSTLQEVLKASTQAYASTQRIDWMLQWPGQVVLCIGSAFWTREVEDAIKGGQLQQYAGGHWRRMHVQAAV
jgi:dynein heavy chain